MHSCRLLRFWDKLWYIISGTVLVETVWNAELTLLVDAIRMKDEPVVLGCVTLALFQLDKPISRYILWIY